MCGIGYIYIYIYVALEPLTSLGVSSSLLLSHPSRCLANSQTALPIRCLLRPIAACFTKSTPALRIAAYSTRLSTATLSDTIETSYSCCIILCDTSYLLNILLVPYCVTRPIYYISYLCHVVSCHVTRPIY